MSKKPVTAVIVGAGRRSFTYAQEALKHPDDLKIVGVADVNPKRCKKAAEMFGFSLDNCFDSAESLAKVPRFADAVINGTMDSQHVETSIPLLEKGYDMLLEKPFAVSEEEMNLLVDTVKKNGNKVMICHVLRYAPFYAEIKKHILSGDIGKIINIRTSEHVSYHHASSSYVRGKWANSDICKTSMLLAKCCHDIDIVMWLMSETVPQSVSSYGSIIQYKPEAAPENAGTKCLIDCPLVDTCAYSAKRIYLENPARWAEYVWNDIDLPNPTDEQKYAYLTSDAEYGKCIYKCNNNVVDHQNVMINFANGATASHSMICGTARSQRDIEIIGTKGELTGVFEDEKIHLRLINPSAPNGYSLETIDISSLAMGDAHGGGDERLVEDFISLIRGETPSVSCTKIEDSVFGHQCVFLADKSRLLGGAPQLF